MVDVIGHGAGRCVEFDNMRENGDDIAQRESAAINLFLAFLASEAVVEAETSDAGEIVALFIKD